jgi:putative ABC transport system permease protein
MQFLIEFWESVKIAFSAIWSNKLRALLTLLGIIVGVSTVIGIMSLTQGLDKAFGEQISSLGSDVLYVQKFAWFDRDAWQNDRNRKDITMKEVKALKENLTLAGAISPVVSTRRTIKFRNKSLELVSINGTDHEKTGNVYPEFGRDLSVMDVDNRRNVVVVGWEVADKLFDVENPVGQWIKISGHPFKVIGVLEKQGSVFGHSLDTEARIPIGAFFKIFGRHRSVDIQIKVKDVRYMEEAKDEIRGVMRRVRRVPPGEKDNFGINQMDAIVEMYENMTMVLYAAAIGVGAISLLVGGIGIMNIMLVSVTERTREIGIRKAIGARRRDILWQFLIESVAISAIGGLIGIGVGFLLGVLIAAVSPIPAAITLPSVILGIGFSSSVGIFFGIYPASKAARLSPIEALRYE